MPATPTKKTAASTKGAAVPKAAKTSKTIDGGDGAESVSPAIVRLKELVDRVVASTGGNRKNVKEVVEATLAQLGLALNNGETLVLSELGKVRVVKAQGAASGSTMTLKLRPASARIKKKPVEGIASESADPAEA